MLIGINSFAQRQTAASKFSHYSGSWEELVGVIYDAYVNGKTMPGHRDGVLKVLVRPAGFFSGVVEVDVDTKLQAAYDARRPGEMPYIQVAAIDGKKLPAKAVEVIIYRRDVLLEDKSGGPSTNAEWEIVSINARATDEPEPLTPMAMARNMLSLPGGTQATYTAEEFAKAIVYWSQRAMCG